MIPEDGFDLIKTETCQLAGKLHRINVYRNGTKEWCVDGELHREGGPAVIRSDGTEEWWVDGKPHREDGPAVIRFFSRNGHGAMEWWLNGMVYKFSEWIHEARRLDLIDKNQEIMLILTYQQ